MNRKVLLCLVLVVLLITVVGCSAKEKKLICNQSKSGIDIEFNVGFKDNKITAMDFNYNMDLSKYKDNQIKIIEKQDFCKLIKSSMTQYKDAFTDCKQKVENKKLLVNSVLNVDKIAKTEKSKIATPEDGKKELEKQGYTCEIK